jgi:hypothetical protein
MALPPWMAATGSGEAARESGAASAHHRRRRQPFRAALDTVAWRGVLVARSDHAGARSGTRSPRTYHGGTLARAGRAHQAPPRPHGGGGAGAPPTGPGAHPPATRGLPGRRPDAGHGDAIDPPGVAGEQAIELSKTLLAHTPIIYRIFLSAGYPRRGSRRAGAAAGCDASGRGAPGWMGAAALLVGVDASLPTWRAVSLSS